MKRILTILMLALSGMQASAYRVVVTNLSDTPKTDYPVVIKLTS